MNKLINEFDMISRWPKRPLDKEVVINWLSEKFEFDKKKINSSLTSTSFKNLSQMENKEGFHESATSSKTMKKIKFFNLGKKNNWKSLLDKEIAKKIENRFKNEMSELGYL